MTLDLIRFGAVFHASDEVLECRRRALQETELTIKTLITNSDNKPRFVTESSDPDYQISLPVFGSSGAKIRPIALVIGLQQPE